MVAVAQREHLRTHRPGSPYPGGEPDHHGDREGAAFILPDAEGDQDQQHKTGDDGEDVGDEHDNVIHPAADIACQQPQGQADGGGNQAGDKTDLQRDACGLDQHRQHIPAEVISAERQHAYVRDLADIDIIILVYLTSFRQGACLRILGRKDFRLGRKQTLDRGIHPLVISHLGIGHPGKLFIEIVFFAPQFQQAGGVGDIDLAGRNIIGQEPGLHILAHLVG